MGTGCQSVWATSNNDTDVISGIWYDGRIGTLRGIRKGHSGFGFTAYHDKSIVRTSINTNFIYREILKEIIKMFETGEPPINISESDAVNAFADGNQIVVTRGMLRFAQDDTELALIIGHELAHNVMGHINSKMINAIPGFLLDLAAGVLGGINTQGLFSKLTANAYSQEFEAEADYVGMYMMALAGLKFEGAPNFWRRMASIHPGSIQNNHMASHPATPERFLALEQTVAEIKGKLMRGELLTPEKINASFWDFLNDDDRKEEVGGPSNYFQIF